MDGGFSSCRLTEGRDIFRVMNSYTMRPRRRVFCNGLLFLLWVTALAGCASKSPPLIDWTTLAIQVPEGRSLPLPLTVAPRYDGAGEKRMGYLEPRNDRGIVRYDYAEHTYDERALLTSFGKAALKQAFADVKSSGDATADVICTMSADAVLTKPERAHQVEVTLAMQSQDGQDLGTYRGSAITRSATGFDKAALHNAYTLALFDAIEKAVAELPANL